MAEILTPIDKDTLQIDGTTTTTITMAELVKKQAETLRHLTLNANQKQLLQDRLADIQAKIAVLEGYDG